MDTSLGLRTWHWRAPDWAAAAVSGFAAGAVLMVLDMLWSTLFNAHGPWRTAHMIAPIFIGTDVLKESGYAFSVTVVSIALVTHYLLGILFGVVMAVVIAQLRLDATRGAAVGTGAMLGMVLYVVNFEGLVAFFPWLADLSGGDTLAAHVLFGMVAGYLYWRLKRTGAEA